uniref:DUF1028 domain-containing protein n=1 Tax=Eiseniibacteriota bacterium TaxID=2212470 RepID=A0A832HZL1_UNCEI
MSPLFALPLALLAAPGPARAPVMPVTTYSIVARDPATGELGVAVQSHYFSVGPIVPWAEPGVGAVATQSLVLVDYGPNGLALMRDGMGAAAALDSLLRADPNPDVRQVAMVDARGNVAAHTGRLSIPEAGHRTGHQYSVQANLMHRASVWPAMAEAYERARGDLAERMLAALEAAEREGGDIRGRQSAALVVVRAEPSGRPWADRLYDLRVEDHPRPLEELRRLVRLRRAYHASDAGDHAIAARRPDEALRHYEEAARLAPEVVELQFWAALSMYTNGREAEGRDAFRRVFARQRRWAELVPRLAKVGLFPDDAARLAEVAALASRSAPW